MRRGTANKRRAALMRMAIANSLGLAMLVLGGLTGCGGDAPYLVPVSGRVTRSGQPVAGAHLSFQPQRESKQSLSAGPASFATTDAAGRFELHTIDNNRLGAMVGKHQVTISSVTSVDSNDDAAALPAETIPARFQDGSVEFDVPAAGTDTADFDVSA